jgi:hypothetical protein
MVATPTRWRPETQVNTTDAAVGAGGNATQYDGQIVGLPDGGYLVVWTDWSRVQNPDGTAVMGQRYDALGARVGSEFPISNFMGGDQLSPAITALPAGGIAVAFRDLFAGNNDIYVRRVTAGMTVVDTIDSTAAQTLDPSITSLADGSYVVAYTVGGGADTDIAARFVSATGVVGAQQFIHDQTDNSNVPELATLSNGNFVAVFEDEDNGADTDIRFRILQPNLTAVTASTILSGGGGPENEVDPHVAALRDGGFVVAWTDQNGGASGHDITATICDNAGLLVNAFIPVNSTSAGNQNNPDVIALADGGFLVTWEDHGADRVRGQRFEADGDRIGSEFTVRTGLTLFGDPETALLTSGRFAYAVNNVLFGDFDVMTSVWDFAPFPAMDPIRDVFWRHMLDGDVATTEHALGVVPFTWTITGTGDFDGDGDADVLWRHRDGPVVTWEMQDGLFVRNHALASASSGWRINNTGDFDGDGDDDILWRHTDGAVVTWEMQDGRLVTNHSIASASSGWGINGTGDFDADGDDDILWRHTEGAVVTWEMEDGAYITNHYIEFAPSSWHIRLVGDFDGDGDGDLLWRNNDGATVTWEMEDGDYVVNHNLAVVSTGWGPEAARDFDGDRDSDILWRHSTGDVVSWEMEAGVLAATHFLGIAASGWQVSTTGEVFAVAGF